MSEYRTLDDVTVEYFSQHPEEIDPFLNEAFADYAEDEDSAALLTALRIVARVKDNPRLDNINSIMRAMGYQLLPHRLETNVNG